jgi:nickel/cobalt exporter
MESFSELLRQGAAHAWLFVPSAILLGALHGLEPGHSKTMMAAFIVAIRGTAWQAVLLGLSATLSHTAVVWAVALTGLYFGSQWDPESSEPYFQVASAVAIIGVALWMIVRTWRAQQAEQPAGGHHHAHDDHDHPHDDEHPHPHPHHDHQPAGLNVAGTSYQDEHEREHATAISRRFANRHVTTGQIVLFGLTGGLIPCPAAITVLLLCLQLREFTLGTTLVLCFSLGLAAVMVGTGVAAAIATRHVGRRWDGFEKLARRAPYFSGTLIVCIGLYVGYHGVATLVAQGTAH